MDGLDFTNRREVGWPAETDVGNRSTEGICCSDVGSRNQGSALLGQPVGSDVLDWISEASSESESRDSEVTPGGGKRRSKCNSSATEEEHRAKRLSAVKAEGATGDSSQFVVDAFSATVGETSSEKGQNAFFVFLDCLCELHKGFQLGSDSPSEPPVQLTRCIVIVGLVKNGGERFFEKICPVERRIVTLDFAEFSPLLYGEVPRIFEEDEFRLFHSLRGFWIIKVIEFPDHCAPHLIQSLGGELLNVKPIEDNRRVRCIVFDGLDICRRHIDGDGFKQRRSLFPKLEEEVIEGLRSLALICPDDALPVMVDHDGDVSMAFPVTKLIDTNIPEIVQSVRVDVVLDDTSDDIPDSAPRYAHDSGDLCLVGNLRQVGNLLLKGTGKSTIVPSPRNQLDVNTTGGAVSTSRSVFQDDRDRGHGEVNPIGGSLLPIVACPNLSTYRTSWSKPPRPYGENDTATGKSDKRDNYTGDLYQNAGKLIHAHVFSGALSCSGHKTSRETCAFSFCVATLRDCRRRAA